MGLFGFELGLFSFLTIVFGPKLGLFGFVLGLNWVCFLWNRCFRVKNGEKLGLFFIFTRICKAFSTLVECFDPFNHLDSRQ